MMVLAILLLLVLAAPADAARRAPCRPDLPAGPKCSWWSAKVRAVDDGDTLKVHFRAAAGASTSG